MRRILPWTTFVLATVLALGCSGSGNGDDGGEDDICPDDPIYQECKGDPNPIWCYHDVLVDQGDADRCEDILDCFDDIDRGVVGFCQYNIALATRDCSICSDIVKPDIHDMCVEDVC